MAALSDSALWSLAQRTFGAQLAPTMYAIAKAESGGRIDAYNPKGEDSVGLWQINRRAWPQFSHEQLATPEGNAAAARQVLAQQGLDAWTTYTGGHYRQHLPQGGGAMPDPSFLGDLLGGLKRLFGGGDEEEEGFNPLDPTTWTPEERVGFLGAAGFQWQRGNGDSAIWVAPDGRRVTELNAFDLLLGYTDATGEEHAPEVPKPAVQRDGTFSGSGLPAGFVQGADGFVYRQSGGSLRKATDAELAAVNAQVGGSARDAESVRQFDDAQKLRREQFAEDTRRFGVDEAYRRDALRQQGQIASDQTAIDRDRLGFQTGPQFEEEKRQAAAAEADRRAGITGFVDGAPTLDRQRFGQTVREQDRRFGFDQSQAAETAGFNRARLGEDARQANLSSATQGFQTVANLTPQLGRLALDNAGFTRDVLRSPSDYVARAFFQRGGTSPLPQVSQADIINQLRSNIEGFNKTLSGFNPQVGAYAPPPAYAPPAPQTVTTQATAPAGFVTGQAQATPATAAQTAQVAAAPSNPFAGFAQIAQRQGQQLGQFAHGGFTQDNMVEVGDSKSGKPTGFEEIVIDLPNDGGLMVIPKDRIVGKRKRDIPRDVPKAANGGLFGFNMPSLPVPDYANQGDLQQIERSVRPPAVSDVLSGRSPSPMRFGFQLPTAIQYGQLTPDDREALGTTLALNNESLADYEFGIRNRFLPSQRRGRAAFVGGFA